MAFRKHILSLVVFLAVAVGSTYLALLDESFNEEQYRYAVASVQNDTDTFASDPIFGTMYAEGQLPRQLNPFFLRLLKTIRTGLHVDNALLTFRLLVGPMCMVFLCGMYFLLFRITASSTVSAFVAILSMGTIETVGTWHWGVGALATVTPAGLFLALSPFLVRAFVYHRRQPMKLVRGFALIGLAGNLHLPSAVTLGAILLVAYLIERRIRRVTLLATLGSIFAFSICILPAVLYELSVMHSLAAPTTSTPVEVGTVLSALRYCPGETLYPELVSQALQWAIYIGVLLGLAVTMLWRHDDEHTSLHLGIWIWVALLGALVSLGGIGLMQFLATSQKCLVLPPVILQASCWTMLALFVLLARGLRNVTRVMRFSPGVLFWARIVLLLAWLLPSDNCSVVRHHLYEWFTAGLRESDKPMRLQELRDRHVALREMEAIGLWLRKNTPADTLIVTNQPRMRVCARRGVLVIQSDVTMLVQHAPWLIETWHRLNSAQDRWFSKPIDPKVIADGFRKITAAIPYHARLPHEHCYLLLPAHTNLVEVHPLEDIRNPDWGQQYRLLRLPK